MRSPLLPYGLLTSTVALTLGHAAVIGERACTTTNTGYLQIYKSTVGAPLQPLTYVNRVADGVPFGQVNPQLNDIGLFTFQGCPGDYINLYCTNCDSDSTNSAILAIRNADWDSNGKPIDWIFYNYGTLTSLRREDDVTRGQQPVVSWDFYWDIYGTWITPSTAPIGGVSAGPLNAFINPGNEIDFIKGTFGANQEYYALAWVDT